MTDQHGSSTPHVFIDALDGDSAGNIVVTLCTIWDVKATNARLLNIDFVVSDPMVMIKHVVYSLLLFY
jgi:hypothetical protein